LEVVGAHIETTPVKVTKSRKNTPFDEDREIIPFVGFCFMERMCPAWCGKAPIIMPVVIS
jgi:hypothetical protein